MKLPCCRQPTFTDPPRFLLDVILSDSHQYGHPANYYQRIQSLPLFQPYQQSVPRYTSHLTGPRRCCSVSYAPTSRHISPTLTLRQSDTSRLLHIDGNPDKHGLHHLILPSDIVINTFLRWSNHPTALWRDGAGMLPLHTTFQGNSVALIPSMGPWFCASQPCLGLILSTPSDGARDDS